jgi:RNA-dependent RNA polymerase
MNEMVDRTRLPARLFLELQNADELIEETDDDTFVPSYCVQIPRLLLTPTRVSVIGFEVEMSNRVVRKFVEDYSFRPESFCRVSIGDENGDKLFSSELSGDVSNRIEKTLLEGIEANGVRYQFLAYSSSQLKEASVWMVRVENRWTIPQMREWMGDFSCCKTPSKYAARMGQCFSTTFQAQAASEKKKGVFDRREGLLRVSDRLPDVVIRKQGDVLCHSDGTGVINTDILRTVVEGLPFAPKDSSQVSIIQVRIGGAKGTLTGWNLQDLNKITRVAHPVGFDVYLRPSMVKFKAPYRHLEVVKIGARTPYYLNRHVILLLNASGVSIDTFCEMQRTMLDDLNMLLIDRDRAMDLLPSLGGADSTLTSTLMHMINSGLSPSEEPFLYSCLHAIRAYHLTNLRKKARIFVEKGVVLMAGLDESGLLPDGCVFLQLQRSCGSSETDANASSKDPNHFAPILGPVMVTKHPALHPGDVRMLLAVDIPELRGHKNVLLFSQRGSDRPEADKMSGSDLDGDEFAITWDTRLFLAEWNRCVHRDSDIWVSTNGATISATRDMARSTATLQASNRSPGSYQPAVQIEKPPDDVFSNQQLVKYMLYFAKNDNIGRIANLWLDHAAKDGATSLSCVNLAHWCSIAVDFPKSGIPAVVPKELYIQEARAHWRGLKGVLSYHDDGVIGRLYDAVDVNPMEAHKGLAGRSRDQYGQILCFVKASQDELRAELYHHELPARLGFRSSGNEDEDASLRFAKAQLQEYNDDLFTLMNKYKLHSEGELLTGLMRKYHRLNKRRRHAVSEELRRSCREMRQNYRETFFLQVWSFVRHYEQDAADEAIPSRSCGHDSEDEDSLSDEERSELVNYLAKVTTEKTGYFDARDSMDIPVIQDCARRLAAAYYMVTYGPGQSRLGKREQTQALFSFPWIVADVIASGIQSFE